MSDTTIITNVEILGKPYAIRCAEEEVDALQLAAEFLSQKMEEVKTHGKVLGLDKIAIISALNIAHQFLKLERKEASQLHKVHQRLLELQVKVDEAFEKTEKIDEFAYPE